MKKEFVIASRVVCGVPKQSHKLIHGIASRQPKDGLAMTFFFLMFLPFANAGTIALVYENEKMVQSGSPVLGTVVSEGVLISAKVALSASGSPLVGVVGDSLRKGNLIRLDNTLDVALIGLGEAVPDEALQKTFLEKSKAFQLFLPLVPSPLVGEGREGGVVNLPLTTDPFLIKINGNFIGPDPIVLPRKKNNSEFKLEIIRTLSPAVWRVSVELTSNPALSFWKKGKEQRLNDVPQKKFIHNHQVMFRSLAAGASFTIPIEVYFIKEESCEWTLHIKSKEGTMEKKFNVIFKS